MIKRFDDETEAYEEAEVDVDEELTSEETYEEAYEEDVVGEELTSEEATVNTASAETELEQLQRFLEKLQVDVEELLSDPKVLALNSNISTSQNREEFARILADKRNSNWIGHSRYTKLCKELAE